MYPQMARLTGFAVTGLAIVGLVAGPVSGNVWRAVAVDGAGFGQESTGSGLGQPGGDEAGRPELAPCDWDPPPRPDSALDLPDPHDYLAEGDDGAMLLPSVQVEFNGHRLNLAALVDLMTIAEQYGIGVEEAIFRWGWQEQFSDLLSEVTSRYPEQYTGGAITADGCGAWIGFTGPVPPAAAGLVADLPVPVELVADRGFAEAELADLVPEVYYPVYEHPEVANAMGSPDHETGVITIHAQPRGSTTQAERDRVCAALQPPAPANPAIMVRVILVENLDTWPETRSHAC